MCGVVSIVAGIVALYRAAKPSISAAQVVSDIVATTKPIAPLSNLYVSGGVINAAQLFGKPPCP